MDRLVAEAKRRNLTDVEVARALRVEKQVYWNWKRRGLPPAMHKRVAEFLGCSIDELVGRSSPGKVAEATTVHGYGLTPEGARLGVEWQKLDEPMRIAVQTLIEILVAASKRDEKKGRQKPRFSDERNPRPSV